MLCVLLHYMDVKTSFMNGYHDEVVYMYQAQGFEKGGQKIIFVDWIYHFRAFISYRSNFLSK